MQPGWYPDPDDENARRYWDGRNWSAPLPNLAPRTAPSPLPQPARPPRSASSRGQPAGKLVALGIVVLIGVLGIVSVVGTNSSSPNAGGSVEPGCGAACESLPDFSTSDDQLTDLPTDDLGGLTDDPTLDAPQFITYKITGNGTASSTITWTEGPSDSIEQATNRALPWSKRISEEGSFFSISAQDDDGTSITCEIDDTVGNVLDKHTAVGQYAIASCQSDG